MNKICVYTCITGNYDNLIEIKQKEDNIDYICFTNNKSIKSNTWDIRYFNEDMDNLTLSRKVKILGYQYLPEYELLVWIDGAVKIEKPVSQFLKECCELESYDMIVFRHKYRDCIYDEINECVRVNKETIDNAARIEKYLRDNNYPSHNGLSENTVLIRKNIESVNKLMDDWFYMVSTFSSRDQLSFNFCLWKNPIRIKFLDMYVFDNEYFKHQGHNEIKRTNKYRVIFGDSNSFNYKYVIDGIFKIQDDKVEIKQFCTRDTNVIVVELYDEIGSIISDVTINGSKDCKFYNVYDFGESIYFHDKPIITFEGNFKKDSEINITFNLKRNTESDLVKTIKAKNDIIIELINKESSYLNQIQSLRNEHNMLLNSKTWKIASKIASVKKIKKIGSFFKKNK